MNFLESFATIVKNLSHLLLRFSSKFLGKFPRSQNISVLLKKFYKISSQLVYILSQDQSAR